MNSTSGKVISFAFSKHEVLVSQAYLVEVNEVLSRPKFRRWFSQEDADTLIDALLQQSFVVVPTTKIDECRDPKDNFLLSLAVDGKADALVAGDKDLLVLSPFRGIAIVRPADFLAEHAG